MKAFSFIRSSLAGGCYQGPPAKPEDCSSGVIPKVPSLLFDLELEDGGTLLAENQEDLGAPAIAAHIRSLTEPRSEEECQLASHMQLVQRLLSDNGERQSLDIFEVADGLRKLGHAVTIRSALGGGGGNECLRNLRHRFLTCRGQGMCQSAKHKHMNYIVDPSFKEQFEIPHVTPRYNCVLSEVPATFIGTEEQVIAVVEIMSKEISRVFQHAGATLPPWRQTASMLSKWQPRKSEDLSFEAQNLDNRAPSLPQDFSRLHLTNTRQGYLQRHSTYEQGCARTPGATARVSLDEPARKGHTSLDETLGKSRTSFDEPSKRKVADGLGPLVMSTCSAALQPAGVVATVQQSINALGRKASSNHAVHLM